jgi:site-specific recombinase XerD
LISACGPKATRRYFEFFTANIRNRNTREAYHRALNDFFAWLDDTNVSLIDIEPVIVAAYVEYLGTIYSKPTVKQHLAAIRMCMDWLVVGQIIPMNPASSVRGPKYVIKRGKTPVLTAEEVEVKEFCK